MFKMTWTLPAVVGAVEETVYELVLILEGLAVAALFVRSPPYYYEVWRGATIPELYRALIGAFVLFLAALARYAPPYPPGPCNTEAPIPTTGSSTTSM